MSVKHLIDSIKIQEFNQTDFGHEFHHVTVWLPGTFTAVVDNGFIYGHIKYVPGQRVYFDNDFNIIPKPEVN